MIMYNKGDYYEKIISAFLSVAMMAVMCVPAFASNDVYEQQKLERLKAVAYMNLDTASEEMRAQILEAREEIIFSQSWVADGMSGRIRDKNGNIKE